MIKNRRRSKAPFIIGGVIVVASAALIYLNFNPIKPKEKEEYFPQGSLCEAKGMEFLYQNAGKLDLTYAFQTTAYKMGIPAAAYSELPSGVGAKVNDTQYVYIGSYKVSDGALATVLNEVPLLISDNYNRNGSHAETKISNSGYIYDYSTDYQFVTISADFGSGATKDYYAAYYSIDTADEEYSICVCSLTEGTNDGSKNLCVSWIDTISASIIGNPDFRKPTSIADINLEDDEYYTGGKDNTTDTDIEDIDIIEETPGETEIEEDGETDTVSTEDDSESGSSTDSSSGSGNSTGSGNSPSGGNGSSGGNGNTGDGSSGTGTTPSNPSTPSHTHSYNGVVITDSTCYSTGIRTYTCSCGQSYTEAIPTKAHTFSNGSCTVCGASDPSYVPPAPSYNGSTDIDHNSFQSPFGGVTMTVSVWTSAAADGCVCTMTCPDGSTVTASGGGTSFTFVVTSQEGTYTINITHASKIGSWGASINFGG